MHRSFAVLVVLALAACNSAAFPSPPPPGTARAFLAKPDLIEVVVSDYVPADRVDLVGPLGVLAAYQIDTDRQSGYDVGYPAFGSLSLGGASFGGGGASFGGIGLGFPLGGSGTPAYPGLVISTAYIRLPELPSYAANWQSMQVRIQFGAPPAARYLTVPAPAPLPD